LIKLNQKSQQFIFQHSEPHFITPSQYQFWQTPSNWANSDHPHTSSSPKQFLSPPAPTVGPSRFNNTDIFSSLKAKKF
jgi:hypothetical protein